MQDEQFTPQFGLDHFASTSIEIRLQIVPISKADLKQLELRKICFNKNEKMLKQIRIAEDICNNW